MKKFSIEILPKQKDKIPNINKDYFNDAGESPSVEIIKAVESSNH